MCGCAVIDFGANSSQEAEEEMRMLEVQCNAIVVCARAHVSGCVTNSRVLLQEEEKELVKREKEIERELEEKRRKREGKLKVRTR